ncbi:major capsid protein [Polycladidibacter hongkongensis]|uniref:major capsid protein n=1 Tax=Polycladidibacter hongkongensis TaxID=1647556 RepID=UPI000832251C|nr:major capsid protein [Pseudovibrio hongkongensis]
MPDDIYMSDPFSVENLTIALNENPTPPGQIGASGLFEEESLSETYVSIERQQDDLALVGSSARGGPGETTGDERRDAFNINIPHFQRDDLVSADSVQNVREFGTQNTPESVQARIVKKAQKHARDLDNTLEHQRSGAIAGIVTDKNGLEHANLYQQFGYATPDAVQFDKTDKTKLLGKVFDELTFSIEDDLDRAYNRFHAFTGNEFHTWLWNHDQVRETFLNTNSAGQLRQATPDVFQFGGFTFERYKMGKNARKANGGSSYIASNQARVVPFGVQDMFKTCFGPADYVETVNTLALPLYLKQFPTPNGKGRHIEVQMNAISLCTRPQALRKLTLV